MNDATIDKLAKAIAEAIANPDIANVGKIRNPYKEFAFSIADDAIETIDYTFDFWRMLTLSTSTGVSLRFGKTGTPTSIVDAGVGGRIPDPIDNIQIINESGATLTGTIGLAIGDIFDDRLNVSGAVNVAIPTVYTSTADLTIPAATLTTVQAALAARHEIIITNVGGNVARIGDAGTSATRGTPLLPNQTLSLKTTAQVRAYSTLGTVLAFTHTEA